MEIVPREISDYQYYTDKVVEIIQNKKSNQILQFRGTIQQILHFHTTVSDTN